jgi:hypothetical protein
MEAHGQIKTQAQTGARMSKRHNGGAAYPICLIFYTAFRLITFLNLPPRRMLRKKAYICSPLTRKRDGTRAKQNVF